MVKESPLKTYFELKQRFIDNKQFLVQVARAKSETARRRIVQQAKNHQLEILRALIKNIADRNIEIEKSLYHQLENKKKTQEVVKILKKFQKQPSIYSDSRHLRQFLLNSISVLPYLVKTILKHE